MGATGYAESRLLWGSGAAVIDLAGTWLAHPLPGRVLRSEHVDFDANHMLERCRLFLIIAWGNRSRAPEPPSPTLLGPC